MRAKESRNGHLMRLSEQVLAIVGVLKEASKNFRLFFLLNQAGYKFKNHLRMYRK